MSSAQQEGDSATPGGRPQPVPLEPGTLIENRYRIVRRIAQGGMGEVYEAEHIELKKAVALKVMLPDLSKDPEFAARFKREAVAASRVGQFNIVDVSDFGSMADGRLFLAMELLDGKTLAHHLREEGHFPAARAIHVGKQIARALAAAHDAGIVHRDLKPENVMLLQRAGQPDFVKVLDFGIAKISDIHTPVDLTLAGHIIGTPQYMSPEQAAGLAIDPRSDVYSLGLILYEMLNGKPPFTASTSSMLMSMQMTASPPPMAVRVPPPLEDLVFHTLAKKPEERPVTMHEVVARLDAKVPLPAGEETLASRSPERKGQRIARLFFGSVVLAIGLGFGAAELVTRGEQLATEPPAPLKQPPAPAPAPPKPAVVRDVDGFGCTSGRIIAGAPQFEDRAARPKPKQRLRDTPPLAFRSLAVRGRSMYSHTGDSLWVAELSLDRLTLLAGQEDAPQALITGPCAQARFSNLSGVVAASDGSLFLSDQTANVILRVTNPGTASRCRVEHWAGSPKDIPAGVITPVEPPNVGDVDGPGAKARFSLPDQLAIDGNDNLYFVDATDSLKRVASDANHTVTTLARKLGGAGGGADLYPVFLSGKVYVLGHDGREVFVTAVGEDGVKVDLLRGGLELFGGRLGGAVTLGGMVSDGAALLLMVNGQLFRLRRDGALSAPLAGKGGEHTWDFSKGYDVDTEHPAKELEIVSTHAAHATAGSDGWLAIDDAHALYVSAYETNSYVVRLECGLER